MSDTNNAQASIRDFQLHGLNLTQSRKLLYGLTALLSVSVIFGVGYWRFVDTSFDITNFIKWGVLASAFFINWIIISTFIHYQDKAKKEQEFLIMKIDLLRSELQDKDKLLNSYVAAIMELEIPIPSRSMKEKANS